MIGLRSSSFGGKAKHFHIQAPVHVFVYNSSRVDLKCHMLGVSIFVR